jgi:hypothetical protein
MKAKIEDVIMKCWMSLAFCSMIPQVCTAQWCETKSIMSREYCEIAHISPLEQSRKRVLVHRKQNMTNNHGNEVQA